MWTAGGGLRGFGESSLFRFVQSRFLMIPVERKFVVMMI
jgi:hypothetical protein